MVTGYAEAPVSVIPRSEATWESPGIIQRNEPQCHTWYREVATALRPRNDTMVGAWFNRYKAFAPGALRVHIY